MKRHISEKALLACILEYKESVYNVRLAQTEDLKQYFAGRAYGIAAGLATLASMKVEDALDLLEKRSAAL